MSPYSTMGRLEPAISSSALLVAGYKPTIPWTLFVSECANKLFYSHSFSPWTLVASIRIYLFLAAGSGSFSCFFIIYQELIDRATQNTAWDKDPLPWMSLNFLTLTSQSVQERAHKRERKIEREREREREKERERAREWHFNWFLVQNLVGKS